MACRNSSSTPTMTAPEVEYVNTPGGVALQIEQRPDGPLIVIEQGGQVRVTRGPFDEAGKLFWHAVNINGATLYKQIETLKEQMKILELQVIALSKDPFKEVIHGSTESVWQEIPRHDRTMSRIEIKAVMDTINTMACRGIQ